MNRSSALCGLLLLLSACSAPDSDAATQQFTSSQAVTTNNQAETVLTPGSVPGATAVQRINQDGATSMEVGKQKERALLRASFETCIARSGGITPDMQHCIADEAGYQDGRLASAYAALRAVLPLAEREALEREQSAWLAERMTTCAWNAAEEGQGQRLDADGCALEMTANRAAQLEARL